MGIVPREVQFRVGMAGVADRVHPVFQHILEIRAVGIMTGCAHICIERRMGVLAFLRFFRLFMAGKTKLPVLCQKHFLVLGGMGGMAGQAALSGGDCGMGDGSLFSLVRMAAETQLVAFIGEEFRVLRIMRVVAGKAHAALERRVFDIAAGLEPGLIVALITELSSAECRTKGLVGRRWIMAHITRLRDYRIMCAGLEKLGLNRRMGIVAC